MSRTAKDKSMTRKKKLAYINDISILDAENFEPPQLSSTPWKSIKNSKRILKDNNSLNISVISNKQDQNKKLDVKIDKQHTSKIAVIKENYKHNRSPKLFYSDPEEEFTEIDDNITNISTTIINDSDDKWTTLTDESESKNCTNISDLLAEIDADVELRFDKPPRRSYPGKKRSNKSMFEDKEETKEIDIKIAKKCRKPKQKKKIDPQEEAFIMSINEHFNDVETFNLAVE
ncbi:Hypothetical protein CINCED_3A018600 [Cinara cedri]|uniref:Uncharacterized protein n=1 Tax=Cinara cedri TaxID=506608 RepID=A0A5E4LYK8_9HEMI|nr:Hypothetical protein CINCED_3A018600 [Cinara cedri]